MRSDQDRLEAAGRGSDMAKSKCHVYFMTFCNREANSLGCLTREV